jgi:hypothetical protein
LPVKMVFFCPFSDKHATDELVWNTFEHKYWVQAVDCKQTWCQWVVEGDC